VAIRRGGVVALVIVEKAVDGVVDGVVDSDVDVQVDVPVRRQGSPRSISAA